MPEQPASPPTYVHRILDVFGASGDQEAIVNGNRRITYAQARSLVEFPPRQKPASFNLDQVLAMLEEAAGGGLH